MTLPAGQACPIYVVSLPDAHERRAGIRQQLDAQGLAFEFVDAVRGSALSAEERAEKVGPVAEMKARINRGLSDGEIGCALSHQNIYEKVLNEGHACAMVLEDDALLLPGFREAMLAAAWLDLDILIFCYAKPVAGDISWVGWYDPVLARGRLASGHVYGPRPQLGHHGTVGYLVSRRACEHLRMNFPVVTVADDYPFFAKALRVWHLRPPVVVEDSRYVSSIRNEPAHKPQGLSLRRRLSYALRGLWRHLLVLGMKLSQRES